MNAKHFITSIVLAASAAFSFTAQAADAKGDALKGKGKAAMCIGCHGIEGYKASFPSIYSVPMIAGQSGKYIASALEAYKGGARNHPTMVAIAKSLNEQDMADLGAYYEALVKKEAKEPNTKDSYQGTNAGGLALNKGNCFSCHGADYRNATLGTPVLAGQHKDYLIQALSQYKNSNAKGHALVRKNGIMNGTAEKLSKAEIEAIAGYLSSLPSDLKVAK